MKKENLIGAVVKLIEMVGQPEMKSGMLGTIEEVDKYGHLLCKWENGKRLFLFPTEDSYEFVKGGI